LIPQADANMEALNTAGMTMGAGGASAGRGLLDYDPNTTRIFGGPKARTADASQMARAQDMAAQGVSRDDIWRDTGWFAGADGNWRFEIDDSGAGLNPEGYSQFRRMREGSEMPLQDFLNHPELNDAYPQFNETTLVRGQSGDGGGYASPLDAEYIGISTGFQGPRGDMPEMLSTNLHEANHGVQNIEGFARGGDMRMFKPVERPQAMQAEGDRLRAVYESLPGGSPERIAAIADYNNVMDGPYSPYDQYQRLAGEVESRNVQARRNMTPEERRATPPWATQEFPDENQIVRFDTTTAANASQSGGLLGAGLSEAQRQARDILDMRAAGRAGDVTDDMMARADDQYMFDNTPLDMGAEARMARADAGGFGSRPVYHGSPDAREVLSQGFSRQTQNIMRDGGDWADGAPRPIFTTNVRKVADTYADDERAWDYQNADPATIELLRRQGNDATVNAGGARFRGIDEDRVAAGTGADMSRYRGQVQDGEVSTDGISVMLSDMGLDGAEIRSVVDDYMGNGGISNVQMTFDPSRFRSPTARFDPEFSHLSNLSAANASPTAGLLAMQQEQDKPLPFMEMLRGLLR
jgi:hypothetical protein